MYETKIDTFNRFKDEKRVKDICKKLNKTSLKLLNIESNFTYFGSKEDGGFTIYNKNKRNNKNFLELNLRLNYPTKNSLYSKEAKDLSDKDYERYIECKYNKSKLIYANINWISIEPKNKGIGSLIINDLIESLKLTESLEMILLHAKNKEAKSFWIKNNFIENNDLDSRIDPLNREDMIYKY